MTTGVPPRTLGHGGSGSLATMWRPPDSTIPESLADAAARFSANPAAHFREAR